MFADRAAAGVETTKSSPFQLPITKVPPRSCAKSTDTTRLFHSFAAASATAEYATLSISNAPTRVFAPCSWTKRTSAPDVVGQVATRTRPLPAASSSNVSSQPRSGSAAIWVVAGGAGAGTTVPGVGGHSDRGRLRALDVRALGALSQTQSNAADSAVMAKKPDLERTMAHWKFKPRQPRISPTDPFA
ncbi:hypothetical protein FE772_03060 [Lysobacter enzymogenes]|nr:hypothetical protein [Lysobacter enzymogenes]QCW24801.1 hypothetical protein FE772_03060 [Lysobacter enzymogenes]